MWYSFHTSSCRGPCKKESPYDSVPNFEVGEIIVVEQCFDRNAYVPFEKELVSVIRTIMYCCGPWSDIPIV